MSGVLGRRERFERVGRYDVLAPLGRGGEAEVVLARAPPERRGVALKIVPVREGEAERIAALIEEGKLAARVRHDNVVSVLDVGAGDDCVFLVLDYVEGDSVSGLVREGGPLPRPIALRVLVDALAGLHAAHELRDEEGARLDVIHRDVSPENVLVGVDGVARLTDFGIARASSRVTVTKTGIFKGKVGYVSPENATGGRLDRRTDVWSAGVLAWELFAGRPLYQGCEDVVTLLRVVTETPPRLSTVCPDVDPRLDEAIAAALAPLDARLPTAEELRRRLLACGERCAERAEVASYVRRVAAPRLARIRAASERRPRPDTPTRARLARWAGGGAALTLAAVLGWRAQTEERRGDLVLEPAVQRAAPPGADLGAALAELPASAGRPMMDRAAPERAPAPPLASTPLAAPSVTAPHGRRTARPRPRGAPTLTATRPSAVSPPAPPAPAATADLPPGLVIAPSPYERAR